MDSLSKKLAYNDKTLESINIGMESFSNAIKNQLSFNKMLEPQLQQLAPFGANNHQGKIPRQPGELETTNLVDIFNAQSYWSNSPKGTWLDSSLPTQKGDLGRPAILVSIGSANFDEAICDFNASINIMPKVIYEKLFNYPLSRTTMYLQLADQSLSYPMGIQKNMCVGVGNSYVPTDFTLVNTGIDERLTIILGRPFLNTTRAIIFGSITKITFNIKGNREAFSFKNRTLSFPAQKETVCGRNKSNTQNKAKTKNKGKQKAPKTETAQMVTAIHLEYDHLLKSPHQIKKDDPGVPTILCSINTCQFYNTIYDTGSDINIMAKVTYEFLYGTMPMDPSYAQLQLADQSFHFVDGIAKNVPVQIEDHYVPTDFLVVDMGEEYDPPIILGRLFLNTTKAIIYIGTGEVHFQ